MGEEFIFYCQALFDGIPHWAYIMTLIVFCAGTVMAVGVMGLRKGLRFSAVLLLLEYIVLTYGSTVFFRTFSTGVGHDFTPFWSYWTYFRGEDPRLLPENVMNAMVFVPIGLLLGVAFRTFKWWQVLIVGLGISVSIETLQFVFKRGFSEFDDVMHNTIGCMIGFAIYSMVKCLPRTFG